MATRRKLVSISSTAATGMHSAAAVTMAGNTVTVAFWYTITNVGSGNRLNTIWAGNAGEYQIYSGNTGMIGQINARMQGLAVETTSLLRDGSDTGVPHHIAVQFVVNGASSAVRIYVDGVLEDEATGSSTSTEMAAGGTHWLFGDDSATANTDDGWIGELFDFCLFDGEIALADLNYDAGEWVDLSATALAALKYRIDGQTSGSPGADSSGNGIAFTVENGGVTLSETGLPPGANPVESGATGTLAVVETGADAAVITGSVAVLGAAASVESGADVMAATGGVAVAGALAVTDAGGDAATIAGALAVSGVMTATETGADVMTASGTVMPAGVTGIVAVTDAGADTAQAIGAVAVAGALATVGDGADTAQSVGAVAVAGVLSVADAGADTMQATGSTLGGVHGALAVTEAGADVMAAAGAVAVSGSLAADDPGGDAMAATGSVIVSLVMTAVETGADSAQIVGLVAVLGSLAAFGDGADVMAASGIVVPIGSGMRRRAAAQDARNGGAVGNSARGGTIASGARGGTVSTGRG